MYIVGKYEWTNQASCSQVDPELWFPKRGEPTWGPKRICEECPVLEQCLEHVKQIEMSEGATMDGIWAGLSRGERIWKRRRKIW